MKIALIYHINFNHLSLTLEQRVNYINYQLSKIIDSININVSVSICAEDLLLLKVWNPNTYKALVSKPNIKFLYMGYSHLTCDLFPKNVIENIKLGKQILDNELKKDKIQNIFYPAEVEWQSNNIKAIAPRFKAILLGESRIRIKNLTSDNYPTLFTIKTPLHKIKAIITRRNFKYRKLLHNYFTNKISPKSVFEGLIQDYLKYGNKKCLVARIDLEVVPLNTPYQGSKHNLHIPLKKFRQLQQYFSIFKKNFVFLENVNINDPEIQNIDYKNITHDPSENYKWIRTDLHKILKDNNSLYTKNKLNTLSLMCSDYYYANLDDIEFNYQKSSSQKITIVKNRRYRDLESQIKLNTLLSKEIKPQSIPYEDKKHLETYIKNYIKVVNYINKKYTNGNKIITCNSCI